MSRAIGAEARDFSNYCGLTLRSTVSFRDGGGSWKNVFEKYGPDMILKIKVLFMSTFYTFFSLFISLYQVFTIICFRINLNLLMQLLKKNFILLYQLFYKMHSEIGRTICTLITRNMRLMRIGWLILLKLLVFKIGSGY